MIPDTSESAVTWSPKPPRIPCGSTPGGNMMCSAPVRAQNAPTSYAARSRSGPRSPYPVMLAYTRRGQPGASDSQSSPSLARASGRRLVTNTSAPATRLRASSRASASRVSSTTLRLPRLSRSNGGLFGSFSPARFMNRLRQGSPSGGSIFTTSAPQSDSTPPAPGPATQTASSTTRTPFSIRSTSVPARRGPQDLGRAIDEQHVTLARPQVERRLRDPRGLVLAVRDRNVHVGVAVPDVHGSRRVLEPEAPRPREQMKVLRGGARGRARERAQILVEGARDLRA